MVDGDIGPSAQSYLLYASYQLLRREVHSCFVVNIFAIIYTAIHDINTYYLLLKWRKHEIFERKKIIQNFHITCTFMLKICFTLSDTHFMIQVYRNLWFPQISCYAVIGMYFAWMVVSVSPFIAFLHVAARCKYVSEGIGLSLIFPPSRTSAVSKQTSGQCHLFRSFSSFGDFLICLIYLMLPLKNRYPKG